jgi:tripartite-type tricarboxylate transporter receptor subunit TctC
MKKFQSIFVAISCALFAAISSASAMAQDYPTKPVRLIVPFVPGGSADLFARLVAPELSEALGQPVVIDNRGGAAGTIGTELASRAVPDGYTILLGTANTAMNVSLYGSRMVNPLKEFAPVALLASAPNTLAVNPSVPVKTVADLVALAKSNPGQIRYASGGSGSTPHLAAELFKTMAKVDLLHVPYKGTGPALVAVISGESQVIFPATGAALPQIRAGKLRGVAICSLARSAAAPDLPTVSESGVKGYESAQWYGVLVPINTNAKVVNRLNQELVKIVNGSNMKARLLKEATTVADNTSPRAFGEYLKAEIAKWANVVKLSGARVE